MAQDEPIRAWPVREPFETAPAARSLTFRSRDDRAGYELTSTRGTHGVLLALGDAVRAITATGEWAFSFEQGRRSWWVAAVRVGSERADAAFYPLAARPGGQIATDDGAYELRHEPVRWDWRLRDEDRRTLVVARRVEVGGRRRWGVVRMELETTPDLGRVQDPAWLVLFTSWIVLVHGTYISSIS
jgi:hypothetical protein